MELLNLVAGVGIDTAHRSDRHHVRAVCSNCLSVTAPTPQAVETPQEIALVGRRLCPHLQTWPPGLRGEADPCA